MHQMSLTIKKIKIKILQPGYINKRNTISKITSNEATYLPNRPTATHSVYN